MFFQNHFKGRNDWYFYAMMVILVAFGYLMGQVPMVMVIFYQINTYPELSMEQYLQFEESLDFSLFHLSSNTGFFLALLIFVFALTALVSGIKWLHHRNWRSLINWQEQIDWHRIGWSFTLWLVLSILFEGIFYLIQPENYVFRPPDMSFFILILIAFLILPLQTSFEELFFRGYLMQAIGAILQNKWMALLLISLLFAGVHSMNPEIREYGLWNMLPYYLVAGGFLAYITIMDDRLELALGVHAATNMFGALFVTYEGAALQTSTLFKTHVVDPLLLSLVFLILSLIFILFASRKYHWKPTLEVFGKWEKEAQV